jgi:DNA-binding GntR family transcriptional regulator
MLKKSTHSSTCSEKTTSVREKTYRHLKSEVLSGSFDEGQRLTELQLAKSLGVSRTPVEMQDLFDIRAALEGFAIRLVCERITEETIEKLQGYIAKAQDALKRKKIDEIFEFNTQFHDTLHEVITHRPRFHSLIADMRKYVLRYRKDSLHYLEGAKRTIAGHRKILLALSLKDPDLCERVMREHVQEAREEALSKALDEN